MYDQRIPMYHQLEDILKTKIVVYVTSDRQGFEAQIGQDAIDIFIDHLDKIGVVPKISLFFIYSGWRHFGSMEYCQSSKTIL